MSRRDKALDPAVALLHATALRHHKEGRLLEAEGLYAQVLAKAPEHADALHKRGLALHALGRSEEAAVLLAKACSVAFKDARVHFNLGVVLSALGCHGKAAEAFAEARVLRPDHLPSHLNYASCLAAHGQAKAAVKAFEAILTAHPTNEEAERKLGVLLTDLGDMTKAEAHLRRALALDPADVVALCSLVRLGVTTTADLSAMERLLESQPDSPALHFALGQAYDGFGDYDRAFSHFHLGNALKHASTGQAIGAEEAQGKALLDVFTPDWAERLSGTGDPSTLPIVITGMPRSGTTLVERIIAAHPKVFAGGERADFKHLIFALAGKGGRKDLELIRALSSSQAKTLGRDYAKGLARLNPKAERVTDKMPLNFRYLPLIATALPKAPLIHCQRDPVDTCLSCYQRLFDVGNGWSYDFQDLARFHRLHDRLMEQWHALLPGRILEVTYEKLVEDTEAEARRIIAHCGLDWDPVCLDFHKTEGPVGTASNVQVRQPIHRRSVGKAEAYGKHLDPLRAALG